MKNNQVVALLYGWIVVFAFIFIGSLILAVLLRFTNFNEPTLSWVTLAVGLLALFCGGLVAGMKGKTKGWMIGCAIGLGFTLLIFLIQYLGYKQGFSLEQSFHHIGFVLAALVGGVLGVNVFVAEK